MCNFLSAIFTRSGECYRHFGLDSHEDIATLFKLRDTTASELCRVEFLPPDGEDIFDISKWTFRIDEERVPSWADAETQARMREKLENIVKSMIVREDTPILIGGDWLIPKGVTVGRVEYGRIVQLWGTVKVNWGTVKVNRGTVQVNRGTVQVNRGTVQVNRGTVQDNEGTVVKDHNK